MLLAYLLKSRRRRRLALVLMIQQTVLLNRNGYFFYYALLWAGKEEFLVPPYYKEPLSRYTVEYCNAAEYWSTVRYSTRTVQSSVQFRGCRFYTAIYWHRDTFYVPYCTRGDGTLQYQLHTDCRYLVPVYGL